MVEENLVGKKLGDYILREKLTSGGMAHIYLGDDEKLDRRAAIKILSPDMAGDDTILRDRFEREARAVAKLEHDSIVPIYQFGEEGNLYFIAMRYIEGNDLADEMKKYKERKELMPVPRMLTILEQVASALDHAHKRGIIHRDVKPSNILLRKSQTGERGDKAVLTDFGLVLWEDVDKTLGTAFGTPRYISPEQATDSQSALPQSDVYSLAVIVYEILTGEALFKGSTPMEVALSHITEPPKPPRAHNPDIPNEAQREILMALQKDPGKRHSTATKFVDALREAYGLHETGTKPPSTPKQDVSTKPLRADKPANLASWDKDPHGTIAFSDDEVKTTPQPRSVAIPKPDASDSAKKPVERKQKSPGLATPIALIGSILVIAVLAYLTGALNQFLPGGGGSANMELRYNEDFLAIVNVSSNQILDISSLRIAGDSGAVGDQFGNQLQPGDCRFVRRSTVQDSAIPDSWDCGGNARRQESGTDIYWRAEDSSDDNFTVRDGSSSVKTCNTAGRATGNAGNQTCSVNWPVFETIPSD